MRDADLAMAEMTRVADSLDVARRQGVCPHLSAMGHAPRIVCTDGCGRVFKSDAEYDEAVAEVQAEWA